MAKRARKRDVPEAAAPESPTAPATAAAPSAPPEAPASPEASGVGPDDTRSLRKAGLFFALAVAALVALKLLLGW